MATETQLETGRKMALELCAAIKEAVESAGIMGVPSGHVYAILMAVGISLDIYESIIRTMCEVGLICKRGDVLYAAKYWNTI